MNLKYRLKKLVEWMPVFLAIEFSIGLIVFGGNWVKFNDPLMFPEGLDLGVVIRTAILALVIVTFLVFCMVGDEE